MHTDPRYAARAVLGVLLALLAAALVISTTVGASGASAEPGLGDAATSSPSEGSTETPSASPSDGATTSTPTGGPTDVPSPGDPTSEQPDNPGTSDVPGDPTTSEVPTEPVPTRPGETEREVADAVFRWGINNQTNAHSHNPVPEAFNFMSAGVANPGRGGITLPKKKWTASTGNVTIQKWDGSRWKKATWPGLSKNSSGVVINASSIFSNHNVVISKGVGTVDAVKGTANITWDGTFTVLYYGGNTMFTVSDPMLAVENGAGVLTAELGGYASSRDGGGWSKVPSKRVTIAVLEEVGLSDDAGFTVIPKYHGVTVVGSTTQDRSGKHSGSFPQPMIRFLADMEIDQFWYSTGLSTDHTKAPLPLSISMDDRSPVEPKPTDRPTEQPTVDNPVNDPPPTGPATTPQEAAPSPGPAAAPSDLVVEPDESQRQLLAAEDLGAVRPVAATIPEEAAPDRTWWLVGLLLLLASGLLLVPARGRS